MSEFSLTRMEMFDSFIRFRKASGLWNEDCASRLRRFGCYCTTIHPETPGLSQEMVNGWCQQTKNETCSSCRARIYTVVNLVKYLADRDMAVLKAPQLPRADPCTRIPHAFSKQELIHFFQECDHYKPCGKGIGERCKSMVLPVFFRLLYSSGIRPNEARMLRVTDVDLQQGIIDVSHAKGNWQHYLVLHDSMLALMREYDRAMQELHPNRIYFFSTGKDSMYDKRTISKYFRRFWSAQNTSNAVSYDFRHNYAITNINSWTDVGMGFHDKMLTLSKSMGHAMLESTKYYYSLVPGMADILREQTEEGFNALLPEVVYEESES